MGLDWQLVSSAPRPGNEAAVSMIDATISALWASAVDGVMYEWLSPQIDKLAEQRAALVEELDWHAIAGAPRVGIDPEALAFMLANEDIYRPYRRADDVPWPDALAGIMMKLHGKPVSEAARDRDALPMFAASAASTNRYDFRGQVIYELEPVLGRELAAEAAVPHSAPQCVDYAARIEHAASRHVGTTKHEKLVIAASGAVAWLRYWGERKAGFWPWF